MIGSACMALPRPRADEHYFPTLLAVHGLDHETDCQGRFMGGHPGTGAAASCRGGKRARGCGLLGQTFRPGLRPAGQGAARLCFPCFVNGAPHVPLVSRLPQMWTGRAWRARRRTPGSTSQVSLPSFPCGMRGLHLLEQQQRSASARRRGTSPACLALRLLGPRRRRWPAHASALPSHLLWTLSLAPAHPARRRAERPAD